MAAPRIFQPGPLAEARAAGAEIELGAEAVRHLGRVLRLGPGDAVRLFDGHGGEYAATLTALDKRAGRARLDAFDDRESESPLTLELVQGLAKGERMDVAIRKAVELGVTRIVPVATARSVVRLDGERADKRHAHWRGVIIAACEQCGRNRLPELAPVTPLPEWLATPRQGVVLDPEGGTGLTDLAAPSGPVSLLVGPEGGLTDDELARAEAAGLHRLRLGPRVLRTETAPLAALTAVQTLWGDLG
ncbi:MAG: 16S rRNA (uracil(1498)-N(3))-methyltransferase [Pseudomonadota bacterium]